MFLGRSQRRWLAAAVMFIFVLHLSLAGRHSMKGFNVPIRGCKETANLTGLHCDGASFQEILRTVSDLGTNLVNLTVTDCKPTVAVSLNQSCFRSNINLMTILVDSCSVELIAPDTFEKLRNLKNLDLGRNNISVILKETFKGLTNLQYFSLKFNQISNMWNGTFKYLGNLRTLDLSYNPLETIEDGTLAPLKNLEMLHIDFLRPKNDVLPRLSPHLLQGLKNLKVLHCSGFPVKYLAPNNMSLLLKDQEDSLTDLYADMRLMGNEDLYIFKGLKRLRTLSLSQNGIGYIPGDLLPKLMRNGVLDLSYNQIMSVDAKAFSVYNNEDITIHLFGNPFYCDCNLRGFTEWVRKHMQGAHGRSQYQNLTCLGPISEYGKNLTHYNPYWWQCNEYIPLIALLAVVVLAVVLALITLVISCNRVNFKHWLLERRAAAKAEAEAEQQAAASERSALVPPDRLCGISSLPKGMTGAYILYNMNEDDVKRWVDHHIEGKLYDHPMKITLQWSAGPDYIPLWKQVKDYGLGVRHFLVLVTEEFLQDHWPLMSENGGVENLSKFVLVLWGVKKKELPKDLTRLRCPCIEWPVTEPKLTSLQREREQFWKRVRLALLDMSV